jgi:predicted lipase
VHKGFLDDYNSIAEQLFTAVNEIRAKTGITRVLVTGHSLGAVLALFTAVDLVIHDGFAEPVLYAFGLPRVGNEGAFCVGFLGCGGGRVCCFCPCSVQRSVLGLRILD